MKLSCKTIPALALVILCSLPVYAADLQSPKREMRSVWLTTVFGIDWPAEHDPYTNKVIKSNVITRTGNLTQIGNQKQRMITILDSLAKNNMNCVNFQVRGRCDAMYKSSYEPWSTDLVAKRGMDPGYDPLQFVVEECHKRGMECHAWVNPYRYESKSGAWGEAAGEYRKEHPDWLYDYNDKSRLNPSMPEVTQRVVDVCREIVTNYDVDGILYDDYFYTEDTPWTMDEELYNGYLASGGGLSQADWRRENVNMMIKAVYDMVREVKPWVRFGISPAGIAASDKVHAAKYGVAPCPGSDWQYKRIWSDPLAWLNRRTLDFISPQVYLTIGHTTDYSKVVPWWSEVAGKFKRHLFISHSITSLTPDSKGGRKTDDGLTSIERSIIYAPEATGPNNDTFMEYANQVRLNREYAGNDAPGSFFYSAKFMYLMAPLFGHYLKNTVFSKPAILPAITYKPGNNPGNVKNMSLKGGKLLWDGYDNVRYTVYAVPGDVGQNDFKCEAPYLLGTSYTASYDIPEAYRKGGYQFAVCVLDRMGNEYSPVFLGAEMKSLPAPALVAPADGGTACNPFDFEWNAVEGASGYILEMAYTADFKDMFRTMQVNGTKFSSEGIEGMKSGVKLYWRVRSTGINCEDGVSPAFTVIPKVLSVLSPEDNSVVNLTPEIRWNYEEGEKSTVEVSTDEDFIPGTIVHKGESDNGVYLVPEYTLKGATRYYVRVTGTKAGMDITSDAVAFTTEFVKAGVPVVVFPEDGGNLYSEDKITLERQPGTGEYVIEVAGTTNFPPSKYVETLNDFGYESVKGGNIMISGRNMVEGSRYFLRAYATYINEKGTPVKTGNCDVISFVYGGQGSGIESNISETVVKVMGGSEPVLAISTSVLARVEVKAFNVVGIPEGVLYEGDADGLIEIPLVQLPKGIHLIAVKINGSVKVVKVGVE